MNRWLSQLKTLVDQKVPVIVVTVASVKGSTPREPGAKMLVTENHCYGTIGGGHLEYKATKIARQQLQTHPKQLLHRFPLGASLGQCCGGLVNLLFEPVLEKPEWLEVLSRIGTGDEPRIMVTGTNGAPNDNKLFVTETSENGSLGDADLDRLAIAIARKQLTQNGEAMLRALSINKSEIVANESLYLFEPIKPLEFHIILFGAGHVGRAVVNVLHPLNCRITWIDNRENQFPVETPSNVTCISTDCPEAEVEEISPGGYYLVMTQDHQLDQMICETILKADHFSYFGLIGSRTKRQRFEQRLSKRGLTQSSLDAMQCPIGVGGIESKQPAAIAISIAAEILQKHEQIKAIPNGVIKSRSDSRLNRHLRLSEERG